MQHVRHAVSAAFVAVVIAAGTTACGSTPKSTASPDPLARLTAGQITERAIADLNEATSVRFAGTATGSGEAMAFALTLVHGQSCQGRFSQQGKGALQMVYDGKSVWIRPSDSLYKSAGLNTARISLLSGKWLKLGKRETSGVRNLTSFCLLSGLVGQLSGDAKMTKGTVTTVDGKRVVAIHQTGYTGTAYISDTAKPELLKLDVSKGSTAGTMTFRDYDVPATISPPPASKTLDGSKFSNFGF